MAELIPRIPDWVSEIVVVDNGSTDASARVAREAGATVIHEERPGYGSACAAGLRYGLGQGARWVVFMDADGSDDPTEMDRLVDPLRAGEADLVIGCRPSRSKMPHQQRFGTEFVCWVLGVGFGRPVRDIGPFRAATAELMNRLPLVDRGFGWTAEMQAEAMRAGASILEVDVSWRPGLGESEISGNWKGVLRAGRDLLRHSLREIIGYRIEKHLKRR